jgi:hypothetical protein
LCGISLFLKIETFISEYNDLLAKSKRKGIAFKLAYSKELS